MKNVTLFIIAIVMVSIFTGCSNQPHPGPVYYNYAESTKRVVIWAPLHKHSRKYNGLQSTAVAIKKAALLYKDHGIKYFYIIQGQAPLSITNMTDLAAYSVPKNNGFHVNDINGKSTSLEYKGYGVGASSMAFEGVEGDKPKIVLPTWSVEEVLNDKTIESYIAAALEDGEYEDKTIEYKVTTVVSK